MDIQTVEQNGVRVAVVRHEGLLIQDEQSALDLIATIGYEAEADRIVLYKQTLNEDFFRLSTGLAGRVLQKFTNYRVKLAIVGDFSGYTSKPLQDFIRESNSGRDIFFVHDEETAVAKLAAAR